MMTATQKHFLNSTIAEGATILSNLTAIIKTKDSGVELLRITFESLPTETEIRDIVSHIVDKEGLGEQFKMPIERLVQTVVTFTPGA